jgi:hypothetical protein
MVASLLKVISSGIQDERLHFKETLYPFVKTWIKAGRFTMQWSRLDFENTPTVGNTEFLRLLRKGHLITRLFLVATMPDIYHVQQQAYIANRNTRAFPQFGWTNSLGHALVQQLTLDIGASRVETMDSRLLEILDEFNTPLEKVPAMNDMIKRKDNGFTATTFGWPPAPAPAPTYQEKVIVPLPFWFTRGDTGCALPIDAIPMDDVRIGITMRPVSSLYYTTTQTQIPPEITPANPNPVSNLNTGEGASLWPLVGSSFYPIDPVVQKNQQPLQNANGTPIQVPPLQLGECYVMAEYVYLDQNEANRFRLSDLQIPVVNHYAMNPFDSRGLLSSRIRLDIPNPCRDIFFMCNHYLAPSFNAFFLATRDLNGTINTQPPQQLANPWWPDAIGLYGDAPSPYMRPGFACSDSEPISGYELDYQGSLVRFRTEGPALFRSILPSFEQRKSPWVNRYYYNFPLGIQNGMTPFSRPQGEANLDKIVNRDLVLQFRTPYGNVAGVDVGRFIVYVYAETDNILRVYGGRAGLMFAF